MKTCNGGLRGNPDAAEDDPLARCLNKYEALAAAKFAAPAGCYYLGTTGLVTKTSPPAARTPARPPATHAEDTRETTRPQRPFVREEATDKPHKPSAESTYQAKKRTLGPLRRKIKTTVRTPDINKMQEFKSQLTSEYLNISKFRINIKKQELIRFSTKYLLVNVTCGGERPSPLFLHHCYHQHASITVNATTTNATTTITSTTTTTNTAVATPSFATVIHHHSTNTVAPHNTSTTAAVTATSTAATATTATAAIPALRTPSRSQGRVTSDNHHLHHRNHPRVTATSRVTRATMTLLLFLPLLLLNNCTPPLPPPSPPPPSPPLSPPPLLCSAPPLLLSSTSTSATPLPLSTLPPSPVPLFTTTAALSAPTSPRLHTAPPSPAL
ncbi:putative uncharacterized protein DDB_G0268590 [Penaeus vannamei]|uniref:putative uncharacterized protein DDB_G0268590 n=1 Tax=Penaeus vannamei TaxID=6689 RepID=UPI00387F5413